MLLFCVMLFNNTTLTWVILGRLMLLISLCATKINTKSGKYKSNIDVHLQPSICIHLCYIRCLYVAISLHICLDAWPFSPQKHWAHGEEIILKSIYSVQYLGYIQYHDSHKKNGNKNKGIWLSDKTINLSQKTSKFLQVLFQCILNLEILRYLIECVACKTVYISNCIEDADYFQEKRLH